MLNQLSLNTLTFGPLAGSSYINLPVQLKTPRKGIISIKNKDQNLFYGVMLDILILQKSIQKEFKKLTRNC